MYACTYSYTYKHETTISGINPSAVQKSTGSGTVRFALSKKEHRDYYGSRQGLGPNLFWSQDKVVIDAYVRIVVHTNEHETRGVEQ
jgi:hypothetical protein